MVALDRRDCIRYDDGYYEDDHYDEPTERMAPIRVLSEDYESDVEYSSSVEDGLAHDARFAEDDEAIPALIPLDGTEPDFLNSAHDVLRTSGSPPPEPHEDVVELADGIFHVSEFNLEVLRDNLTPTRFMRAVARRLTRFRETVTGLRLRLRREERANADLRNANTSLRTTIERDRGGGLPTIWPTDVTPRNDGLVALRAEVAQAHAMTDRMRFMTRQHADQARELSDDLFLIQRALSHPEGRDLARAVAENARLRAGRRAVNDLRTLYARYPASAPSGSRDFRYTVPDVVPIEEDERRVDEFMGTPQDQPARLMALSAEERAYRTSLRTNGVVKQRPKPRGRCMTFMVRVNGLDALVLLDTGSTLNAISPDFARISSAAAFELSNPLALQLGCVGSRSKANFGVETRLTIGQQEVPLYFDVVNIDYYDIILGIPFMDVTRLVIDFGTYTVRIGDDVVPALKGEGTPTRRKSRQQGPDNIMHTFREDGGST